MAKKEDRIIINNAATLLYNGEVISADNIKNIPTAALAKFFVAHLSKNYPFGDIVWEVGKELRARVDDAEKAKEINATFADLAESENAEKIVNMLNPVAENGERTYTNGLAVMNAGDVADAGKLLYSVDLMYVELLKERAEKEKSQQEKIALEEQIKELDTQIHEKEKEIAHLRSIPAKVNRKKKTKKIVMIAAAVLVGAALFTSVGFNIGQKVENNHLKDDNITITKTLDEMKEAIERIARENGYKDGMVDKDGNPISAIQFIEGKMKEDSEGLKKQIADMKQTLRDLSYEVDDSQTLAGIVKNVYDAFQEEKKDAVATEVMGAYLHFANLLEDLGIEPEDIVDENGNLDVAGFDADVAEVVEPALKNADHLRQVQEKIDATFEALGVYKTDGNGNVVTDENGNPVVKKATDFVTFDRAIDEVVAACNAKQDEYKAAINASVERAFAVASIEKEDGTGIYTLSDFSNTDAAIAFLGDNAGTIKEYVDLLEEKQNLIDQLQDKVDELQDDLDTANDEKNALEGQVEDLKKKLEDKETENTDQNGSDGKSEDENVGPVAGEEKDDSNNGGSTRPGSRDDADNNDDNYDEDDLNK